ncbi:three component ABC system middle component [Salisediminibacterium halotolerans]|uniref:Uncharacterized protein n=1 Tax=Salisediminibacterium halotolerans TaxID=517425 RepID=A0A1H9T1J2_9BACI|nr:three component ABC system middle component [Salisediminibacterium haloalkalitolerans]SER91008.1 hypothetical protein SAMN05444126_10899 [Salisediminibacterium haloalkalitolerans]
MKSWGNRPGEISHLLNPAFCGEIIRRTLIAYQQKSETNLEFPLIYLVLPITLHRETRERIELSSRNKMHVWLQANQDIRIGFSERAKQLVPITNEAIQFLLNQRALEIGVEGDLRVTPYRRKKIEGYSSGEIQDIMKKAEKVGKWFSSAGTTSTIFTMWGVRP